MGHFVRYAGAALAALSSFGVFRNLFTFLDGRDDRRQPMRNFRELYETYIQAGIEPERAAELATNHMIQLQATQLSARALQPPEVITLPPGSVTTHPSPELDAGPSRPALPPAPQSATDGKKRGKKAARKKRGPDP
jgi:hypothetical protein